MPGVGLSPARTYTALTAATFDGFPLDLLRFTRNSPKPTKEGEREETEGGSDTAVFRFIHFHN
jgi:hypothetical protein